MTQNDSFLVSWNKWANLDWGKKQKFIWVWNHWDPSLSWHASFVIKYTKSMKTVGDTQHEFQNEGVCQDIRAFSPSIQHTEWKGWTLFNLTPIQEVLILFWHVTTLKRHRWKLTVYSFQWVHEQPNLSTWMPNWKSTGAAVITRPTHIRCVSPARGISLAEFVHFCSMAKAHLADSTRRDRWI